MKSKNITEVIILSLLPFFIGCSSFLDVKSDESLAVPASAEDYLALLNTQVNRYGPPEGEVMAGDTYILDEDYAALFCETDKDLYSWKDTYFEQKCDGDGGWIQAYKNIYTANAVIEGVEKLERDEGTTDLSARAKGEGYFLRGSNHFEIAVLWAPAYKAKDAKDKLGIPLKLTADFNEATRRSILEETFQQVLSDLHTAADLLPEKTGNELWPSRYAALGALARVYLYMGQFSKAEEYAKECIESHYSLFDYNDFDLSANYPFTQEGNTELLVSRHINTPYYSIHNEIRKVDKDLYDSYTDQDLRKEAFFRKDDNGTVRFKGSYSGSTLFSGVALDEMYLIVAEAAARAKEYSESRKYLNELLKHRMAKEYELPVIEDEELLNTVLEERRKELLVRGIRFADLKRLAAINEGITVKRIIEGNEEELVPNDPRYTLLIPQQVIDLSGIEQNSR